MVLNHPSITYLFLDDQLPVLKGHELLQALYNRSLVQNRTVVLIASLVRTTEAGLPPLKNLFFLDNMRDRDQIRATLRAVLASSNHGSSPHQPHSTSAVAAQCELIREVLSGYLSSEAGLMLDSALFSQLIEPFKRCGEPVSDADLFALINELLGEILATHGSPHTVRAGRLHALYEGLLQGSAQLGVTVDESSLQEMDPIGSMAEAISYLKDRGSIEVSVGHDAALFELFAPFCDFFARMMELVVFKPPARVELDRIPSWCELIRKDRTLLSRRMIGPFAQIAFEQMHQLDRGVDTVRLAQWQARMDRLDGFIQSLEALAVEDRPRLYERAFLARQTHYRSLAHHFEDRQKSRVQMTPKMLEDYTHALLSFERHNYQLFNEGLDRAMATVRSAIGALEEFIATHHFKTVLDNVRRSPACRTHLGGVMGRRVLDMGTFAQSVLAMMPPAQQAEYSRVAKVIGQRQIRQIAYVGNRWELIEAIAAQLQSIRPQWHFNAFNKPKLLYSWLQANTPVVLVIERDFEPEEGGCFYQSLFLEFGWLRSTTWCVLFNPGGDPAELAERMHYFDEAIKPPIKSEELAARLLR
jgi:hypothetical protein